MIISNKLNYPEQLVRACKEHCYKPTPNFLRVTELIDAPLIKTLTMKHWDDITVDVDEFINSSLFGTAWHHFLSQYKIDSTIIDHRLSLDINGITISGELDIYYPNKGLIVDSKVTSAYAFVFGRIEWEYQLNLYAYLMRRYNYPVNGLEIHAYLRDWSRYEAMKNRNKDYPDRRFYRVDIPLWTLEKQEQYIQERLGIHLNNRNVECLPHERWEKPTTFAVKKKGVKKARRVLSTSEEAQKYIKEKSLTKQYKNGIIHIEERKGGNIRCSSWCICRNFCPFNKERSK